MAEPTNEMDSVYNHKRWGEGYVSVSDEGELLICPHRDESQAVSLKDVVTEIGRAGLRTPTLVRFKDILHDRVNSMVEVFNRLSAEMDYKGRYRIVYPIKVNQQRRVVEEIIRAEPAKSMGQVGLEAGSKAELLAVLALSLEPGSVIVCNGYKDPEYIRMALIGQALGYKVFIVIEKLSELPVVLSIADELCLQPNLGIRARLSTIGKGNWQNTGGEKSKFGLSSHQMIQALEALKEKNRLNCLNLLHFHLGSQIANIRDMHRGFQECARIYAQLRQLGAPVETVDVGGGLGVDYDGTQSRNVCSMNYRLEDYARNVIAAFKEVCAREQLLEPDLISESGRALTAHHAVLITDVIDRDAPEQVTNVSIEEDAPQPLQHLWADLQALNMTSMSRSLMEIYHDSALAMEEVQALFVHGGLSLSEKSVAERLFVAVGHALRSKLNPMKRDHREILDDLNEKLAEKLFVNISIFQSLPDIWGIDQIFPILPIENLNGTLTRQVVLQDITCDSDGRIDQYVSEDGIESSLSLPDPKSDTERLCFFMVGAYQEILGDMHNLFGDTDSVDVSIDQFGQLKLEHAIRGDTVSSVLQTVHLSPDYLMKNYRNLLNQQGVSDSQKDVFLNAFEQGLESYTYLTRHQFVQDE